jgi:hypothetical protein
MILHRMLAIGTTLDTIKTHHVKRSLSNRKYKVIHANKSFIEARILETAGFAVIAWFQWQGHESGQIAGTLVRSYLRAG